MSCCSWTGGTRACGGSRAGRSRRRKRQKSYESRRRRCLKVQRRIARVLAKMKSRESKGEGDIGGAQVKGMLILEDGRLRGVAWAQMLAMAVVVAARAM